MSKSDQAVTAARQTEQDSALVDAVREGVAAQANVFNTHSQALAGRLIAEERALIEVVADIDAQIAKLNEQRTDAMLAHSMVSHALQAAQRGRS